MADKGKKDAKAPPAAKEGEKPPGEDKKKDKKEPPQPKVKSVQPKNEVGTRKGCRRYRWEFKDSNKEFWVMGHAEVKILSVGCLIAALIMFTGTVVHPLVSLVITMELSIFVFFIFIYTFAINRYMPFILWPVTDLLNDLFAIVFLVGAGVLAVQARETMPFNYFIAVVLIGVAAFFPLIDICLQRKHFRGKKVKRNVLVPPKKKEDAEEGKQPKPDDKAKDDKAKDDKAKDKKEKADAKADAKASKK